MDRREVAARRAQSIAQHFAMVAEVLESDAEVDERSLAAISGAVERTHLAIAGLSHARDGGRREWVVAVLLGLGTLLEHARPDDAWTAWLGLQSILDEPDGPYLDVTTAFVDDRNTALIIDAARCVTVTRRRGRKRADEPRGSAYAALNELFARLPDGDGGTLTVDAEPTLRKLVERAKKKL